MALPADIMELVQNMLDARESLEDVTISAPHIQAVRHAPDAAICLDAAQKAIVAIDTALDLIKYNADE